VRRWYAAHAVWLVERGSTAPGASRAPPGAPRRTAGDGAAIVDVAGDARWLLPATTAGPVRVAGPLFPAAAWPSHYGQVDWSARFAWSQGAAAVRASASGGRTMGTR
jgi:hypothetical protein